MDQGRRLLEVLRQPLYKPMSVARQAIILYIATGGLLEDVPIGETAAFAQGFVDEMEEKHAGTLAEIQRTGSLTGLSRETVRAALEIYKGQVKSAWQK